MHLRNRGDTGGELEVGDRTVGHAGARLGHQGHLRLAQPDTVRKDGALPQQALVVKDLHFPFALIALNDLGHAQ